MEEPRTTGENGMASESVNKVEFQALVNAKPQRILSNNNEID